MNDDFNLEELSRLYHAAKDIKNPSPLAVSAALDLFPKRSHSIRWRRGYVFALAAALVVLLFFFVSMRLAFEAKPNTLLYQFKRSSETVRIAFASSTQERLHLHLLFAEERIEEGSQAANNPNVALVALDEYKKELAQVSKLINAQDDKAIHRSLSMVVEELGDNALDLTELAQESPVHEHALVYIGVTQAMENTKAVLKMAVARDLQVGAFRAVQDGACMDEDADAGFDEYEDAWSLAPRRHDRECQ